MVLDVSSAFISYSRQDLEFALRLAEDLKTAGAIVWLDRLDIAPGQHWDRAIEDALQRCPRMLLILSPSSVGSTNVMDEVSFALEEQKTVIPILFKDCTIPFRLRRVQYIDFRTDYQRGLRELLGAVVAASSTGQSELPALTVPPPPPPVAFQPELAKSPEEVTEPRVELVYEGWIVGSNGTILHTKDSGRTWQKQASEMTQPLLSVSFPSAMIGWAVGPQGEILHTTDGGVHWTLQSIGASRLSKVDFLSDSLGWAIGWGSKSPSLFMTRDGGASWTRQPIRALDVLRGGSFVDSNSGWLCGSSGSTGVILHTEDGGLTWRKQAATESLQDVLFLTRTSGWAVGGPILHTEDSGSNWVVQYRGDSKDNNPSNLLSVDFPTPSSGWAVGREGTILYTADSGRSWQSQASGTEVWLRGVKFATPLSGWVVGSRSMILHTEDGGKHWEKQDAGIGEQLNAITFAPSGGPQFGTRLP